MSESRPARSRWLFAAIVLLGTLGIGVGLFEAALWVVAPIPYDEWMVYENEGHIHYRAVPGQEFTNRFGATIRINKDGFRGPDYPYDKPAGTLRIVVLGGSAAFCYNSGEDESWPGALRIELERRLGLPVEVVNLGLPGFDIFDSKVNYMAYGRAFHPDAVLVYHTWNDMKTFRDQELVPYRPRGPIENKPLWQRIARETQIGRRARNALFTISGRRMENRYKAEEGTGERADRRLSEEAFAWERRNFLDVVTLAQGDDVLPILVSQATLVTRDAIGRPDVQAALLATSDTVGMTLPLIADTWLRVTSLIEEVATSSNAVFVDGYRAVPQEPRYLEDHVHLWDAGSAVLARAIADRLEHDAGFLDVVTRVSGGEVRHVE